MRTLKVYHLESDKDEYLASRGLVNSKLGDSISIYKGGTVMPIGSGIPDGPCGAGSGSAALNLSLDSAAVTAMCKARTDDDLKQTLVSLKLAEPRSRLSL